MKKISESLEAVTHTHTHTRAFYKERRKLIYNFFLFIWSKGGSRFETINGLLPRDLIG